MPNPEGTRPNIVWIFPDEWRHDAAGYAGNEVVRTPCLDALAARGTAFSRAYCESPVCQPSRASLLTCRFPRDHGVTQNGGPRDDRLVPTAAFPAPDADNFLHRLRAAGYFTSEVGKLHFLVSGDGVEAYGFDETSEELDKIVLMRDGVETEYTRHLEGLGELERWRAHQREQHEALFGRHPAGLRAMPEELEPEHALDAQIGARVCERIERYAGREEPFFLWAGFVGPHVPFDGPSRYAEAYDPGEIPLGPLGLEAPPANLWGDYLELVAELLGCASCTEADFRTMARHYYAAISLIDEQIGRIADAVERAGIADRTWIVFSSDHGELLGDHGLITKGVFYDASVRVPALVVPPRSARRKVDSLVQGIDVVWTILELAGADRSGLSGRSLLDGEARDAVFSQVGAFTMAATGRWKLVVETATREPQALYDLSSDPEERRDVLDAQRSVAGRLVATLVDPYLAGRVH